jgi:hypothetical protein
MPYIIATRVSFSSVRTQSQPHPLQVSRAPDRAQYTFAPALHHEITPLHRTEPRLRSRVLGFWGF